MRRPLVNAGVVIAMTAITFFVTEARGATSVNLGDAASFAVLAGSGITNTGTTTISGDIGSYPTPTMVGFGTVTVSGVNHGDDAVTQSAKEDLSAAYTNAAGQAPNVTYEPVFVLGTLTLAPGVYNGPTSFEITGALTLDAGGDPNAVWIFQIGSTLTTASGSSIVLIGGAQASNIFWQVGSSATLGSNSFFSGTILALTSITLTTGAEVNGRALALNGAVTMDGNLVAVPEPGSVMMIGGAGLALFAASQRRRFLSV